MRVAFLVTGLGEGGAEAMLHKLAKALLAQQCTPAVFSLRGEEAWAPRLRNDGVAVHLARMRGAWSGANLAGLARLGRSLARFDPVIVQGWMYHGNLVASALRRFGIGRRASLLWGVRQSLPDVAREKSGTAMAIRLGARCSAAARAIVYNSEQAARDHEAVGFASARRVVIPNGFDLDVFAPDASARASVRAELDWPHDALVVGCVARFHPVKNHDGVIAAAQAVVASQPRARFVLMGEGVTMDNPSLASAVRASGLGTRLRLLGSRGDVPRVTAAFDVAVCASHAEGFPNVVGEAMACAVPCIVTDVGDSARIVAETGCVVPPGNDAALARAITMMLAMPPERRHALGAAARRRVRDEFSIAAVARRYRDLYASEVDLMASSCAG